jgi:large subunit ribosomal protein L24
MNTLHIKKGDTVVVRAGNEKGKSGKVLGVLPKLNMVLVEGIGMKKKHQKSRRAGQAGQIIDKHFPIHASNVSLKDKDAKAAKETTKEKPAKKKAAPKAKAAK